MKTLLKTTVLTLLGLGTFTASHGQHINAGAVATNSTKLLFANGPTYVASSGYIRSTTYASNGVFAGTWHQSPTFTTFGNPLASPAPTPDSTNWQAPAGFVAAGLGSFVQIQIESITGPANSVFRYYENYDSLNQTATLMDTMTLNGSGQWTGTSVLRAVSDNELGSVAGTSSTADPYGHNHGQRYTVSSPGDYLVGFRLIDTSTNGPAGGPVMESSDLFVMRFRAVPEPASGLALLVTAGAGLVRRRRAGRLA
jgi:hypothetical protein